MSIFYHKKWGLGKSKVASSKDRGGAMFLLKNIFTKLSDIVCTNQEAGLQLQ